MPSLGSGLVSAWIAACRHPALFFEVMDSLIDRLRRSAAQRGYLATLQLCGVQLLWLLLPRFRRTLAQRNLSDAEFDERYGVDTRGVFRPKMNEVIGGNWAFGGSYQAADPQRFLDIVGRLALPFHEFTFVDFGSGKGRALLLAALFPFRRIIGVEYCPRLNEVARRNAARFHPRERVCPSIEVQDADAAEYMIPNEPLVLFLYNPFSRQVMSRLVQNVADSYHRQPRRIVVLYFFPELADLWEAAGFVVRLQESPAIFDTLGNHPGPGPEVAGLAQPAIQG